MRIAEIAKDVLLPPDIKAEGKANRTSPPITEGVEVVTRPKRIKEGIRLLSPGEVLGLHVQLLSLGDEVDGYQRDPRRSLQKVREMARAAGNGAIMPSVTIGIGEDGNLYVVDGLKRALAHVMIRKHLRCELRRMTFEQQRRHFHDQSKGAKLSRNQVVLTGERAVDLYVQDVLTAPASPWDGMVTLSGSNLTIGPGALENLVSMYAAAVYSHTQDISKEMTLKEVQAAGDELAKWMRVFGLPSQNTWAWRAGQRRGIAMAATAVFRRRKPHPSDEQRWMTQMPTFKFEPFHQTWGSPETRKALLEHWNRRLPQDRKVDIRADEGRR